MTQVAVVVVTYNSEPLLADLIDSLPEGLGELSWQLVVVDNASADGTLDAVRRMAPEAIVVNTGTNAGYAAAINRGIDACAADFYLLMNPDVRLRPDCVPTLVGAAGPGIGVLVPRLVDREDELIWSQRREPTLVRAWADAVLGADRAGRIGTLGEVVTDPAAYQRQRGCDWAEGSIQLVTSACLRATGPWDEEFFLYSEETDFHLRANAAGHRVVYVPRAEAQHLEGSSGTAPALWALLTANRLRCYRKRHGAIASAGYWAALVAREGTRSLRGDAIAKAAIRALFSSRRLRARRNAQWVAQGANQ